MRHKLEIYPVTHPYIIITEGRTYHLNAKQHEAILQDMKMGKGTSIITYHDPIHKEDREIPLNLFKAEDFDRAERVRENLWKSQGGYVCKDGRMVDSIADCQGNDGFRQKEEVIGVEGMIRKAARSMEARTSFIAGLFCGAARHNSKPKYEHIWGEWDIDWNIVIRKIKGHAKSANERDLAISYAEERIPMVS